jgi:cold shock protein
MGCPLAVADRIYLEKIRGLFRATFEKRSQAMTNGTIKKLVSDRGFGFIAAEDGKEYFFHRDAVDNFDSLNGGEKVTFEVEASPKGPRAKLVKLTQ